MTQHAVYLRLSKPKSDEAKTTDSIESQRDTVHQFMRNSGVDPANALEFVDILSARKVRSAARPGFAAMLEQIEDGSITTIWTRHPDRLYRHLSDLESLVDTVEQTGVKVRSAWNGDVDLSTSTGRTAARITGAIAQGEVESMRERVQAKLAANRAAGRPHGGMRPFGWNRDGSLREDEAELIRRAVQMILDGESVAATARMMEAAGATTDKGNPVSRQNILHIVKSPRLIGQTIHKGQPIGTGRYEPILDEETFGAVQTILSNPARRTNGSVPTAGRHPGNLLTQIAICGRCGSTMNATTATDTKGYDPARGYRRQGSGKTYRRYKCRNRCLSISRDLLDAQAVAAMIRFYMHSDLADLAPTAETGTELVRLRAELGKIEEQRAGIADLLGQGLMTAQDAAKPLAETNARRLDVTARIEKLTETTTLTNVLAIMDGNKVNLSNVAALTEAFKAQPLERQRQQVERVWRPVVRHVSEVGPTTVTVGGREYTEHVPGPRKQERRTVWECLLNPALSFDPVEQDRDDLMATIAEGLDN